jgi:hypothetical protein
MRLPILSVGTMGVVSMRIYAFTMQTLDKEVGFGGFV